MYHRRESNQGIGNAVTLALSVGSVLQGENVTAPRRTDVTLSPTSDVVSLTNGGYGWGVPSGSGPRISRYIAYS